jgi:cyanophycinase
VPLRPVSPVPAGTLCVIGGAEDRTGSRTVLREFVRLAGGDGCRIAVVATASSLGDEILDSYDVVFRDLGAGDVLRLRPDSRGAADDPALAARLGDVDAVFMTGGNQLKLTQVVDGTAFGEAVRSAYLRGALVGGTSAGASAVSEHMIAFGDEADTPRQGVTASAAGLGLLPDVIVDQHFSQRNRYGRLLSLVARSPRLLGLGIDEDTAAVVRGGHLLEVHGAGCVFVADGSAAVSDAHLAEIGAPLLVSGVVVHTLPGGSRFDLATRRLLDFQEEHLAHQIANRPLQEDDDT